MAEAEVLIDTSGGCKAGLGMESATVMPGKTYSYEVAYAVTARCIALSPDTQTPLT